MSKNLNVMKRSNKVYHLVANLDLILLLFAVYEKLNCLREYQRLFFVYNCKTSTIIRLRIGVVNNFQRKICKIRVFRVCQTEFPN